jgi:FKBP-type peptidyl-prolyl cis-trans isomerase FklB
MRVLGLLLAFFFCYASISIAQNLTTKFDSVSYSVGVIVAENLRKEGITELNEDVVAAAIHDIITDSELQIGKKDADQIFKTYLKKMKEVMGEENKMAGELFLAENAKKSGVTVLPSGLQYEILVPGTGLSPGPTDVVKTHYHGTLTDGTIFDSSVERGEPISFPLNRVIKAWQEALPLMKEGGKWRIYSPYDLAYGPQGAGPTIKAYSALIFDIELLKVESASSDR